MGKLKEFFVGFFSKPDWRYHFLTLLLAIISFGLTLFLWKFPEKIPSLIITRDIIIVALLASTSAVLLLKNNNQRHTIEALKASNQFNHFHNMVHKFRSDVFSLYIDRIPDNLSVSGPKEKDSFEKICHSVTSGVKTMFYSYYMANGLGNIDDLCVTVKLTITSDTLISWYGEKLSREVKKKITEDDTWVITAYRDPDSYEKNRNREVSGRIYSTKKNTAFTNIFTARQPYFCNDNLKAMGNTYLNENEKWNEFYNATIAAPIRYYNERQGTYRCFGILAVDSMNQKSRCLFENNEAKQIIGHAADLLAQYFLAISLVYEERSDSAQGRSKE